MAAPERTQDNADFLAIIEDLKRRLQEEHEENAMLRRILFGRYARQPRVLRPLELPLPERAIILFEILAETFTLEEAVAMGERLGVDEGETAEHVRSYFEEGMLDEHDESNVFVKTGYRPYLQPT